MKIRTQIIPLRMVKYNDRHSILTAYSRQLGRVSFLVPSGNGREATRRRALLMPMGVIECVADIRPDRDIYNMCEPRLLIMPPGAMADPTKTASALLIAEILNTVVRDSQADAPLFEFIASTAEFISTENNRSNANLHICFLIRLCKFVGIEPDISTFRRGCIFDLADGVFRLTPPLHSDWLPPEDSETASRLLRMKYSNMHLFKFSREERNRILDILLRFYTLHYADMSTLKSLPVLRSLF